MTTIKTNDRELVAVEVFPAMRFFKIWTTGSLSAKSERTHKWRWIEGTTKYDFKGHKIIGILSELTEQQAAEYSEIPVRNWLNCTAKSALDYTLTVNGLNTSAPILLIEKVK